MTEQTGQTGGGGLLTDGMNGCERAIKRVSDVVFSLMGMVVLSPLFAVIAALIRLQRNGAIIFRQERIGYGGKPFTLYKFRTMSSEIEENGPQLVAKCDDSNSTGLEQWLREHHIDELPQLWNVLKGDMSIVGPRPERAYFIAKIVEKGADYAPICRMRPGLTSEATLYNGYTDTVEKMLRRLEMDTAYYRKRSLWLDFKIAAMTFTSIITGRKI